LLLRAEEERKRRRDGGGRPGVQGADGGAGRRHALPRRHLLRQRLPRPLVALGAIRKRNPIRPPSPPTPGPRRWPGLDSGSLDSSPTDSLPARAEFDYALAISDGAWWLECCPGDCLLPRLLGLFRGWLRSTLLFRFRLLNGCDVFPGVSDQFLQAFT
ncbi:hypothetical protein BAE44_0013952, partial [Dichanthelium oligosanthes]